MHVGGPFGANGASRNVVGLVENPLDLKDEFALVAPGQADPPAQVSILFDATRPQLDAFRPSNSPAGIGTRSSISKAQAAVVVLAFETIGLLFVGLVAAAGFAVMAQRRLRALGMLGALGATDRQVRLAMVANGLVVGVVGAVTGAAVGLITWVVIAPRFEKLVKHRIARFHLPWWALAGAMALAVATAIIAAWWPARPRPGRRSWWHCRGARRPPSLHTGLPESAQCSWPRVWAVSRLRTRTTPARRRSSSSEEWSGPPSGCCSSGPC